MKLRLIRTGAALLGALAVLATGAVQAGASEQGKKLFQEKCATCHSMDQKGAVAIPQRLTEQGPPLWFAGNKFNREWLAGWMAAPSPILGVTWNTATKGVNEHPALGPAEAGLVADYLMTAVDGNLETGTATPFPSDRSKKRKFLTEVRNLFEKHQGCYACHRYLNKRGTELGGFSAPSLVNARERLQGDWVYGFLQNPGKYYPLARCPIPGEKATNKYTDENKADLASYVVNMGER